MKQLAIEKLTKELQDFKGGQAETYLAPFIKKTLADFCMQDEEFAQAVVQSDKTLSQCVAEVAKDASKTKAISDIEAYRRAVQFYFPGADIAFSMQINLSASVEKQSEQKINLSLDDLLDL